MPGCNIEQYPGQDEEDTALHNPRVRRYRQIIRKRGVGFLLLALSLFMERGRERGTMGPSSLAPRVFVVDDEHINTSTLTAILKIHGFSATFFTSPLEALTAARLKARDLLAADGLGDP